MADTGGVPTRVTEPKRVGRPPIGHPIQFRLPAALADEIDEIAQEEGRTRAQVLRDIISLGIPLLPPPTLGPSPLPPPAVSRPDPERYHFIYRWFDASDALLYLGITHNPVGREQAHRVRSWWVRFAACYVLDPPQLCTRTRALEQEAAAIEHEAPVFNRQGARDARTRAVQYLANHGHAPGDFVDLLPPLRADGPASTLDPEPIWNITREDKAQAAAVVATVLSDA